MARPSQYNIVPVPVEALNLEEVRFWLRIMQEHALFIKAGLPCDRTELINRAQAFYDELTGLCQRAARVQSERRFRELVEVSYRVVREFYNYKRELLELMLTCKLGGFNFPLSLDHMAREAEYFLALLGKIREGKTVLTECAISQENTFWVRIMADHAKFMSHLIDPSERRFIETADVFSEDFDGLYLQSMDFVSMLQPCNVDVPSFWRFLRDVRRSTGELRDFKKTIEELICECRLVSLIPELLADHLRREADHFLLILCMMEKRIVKDTLEECSLPNDLGDLKACGDIDSFADGEETDCEEEPANPPVEIIKQKTQAPIVAEAACEEDEEDYDDDADDIPSPLPPPLKSHKSPKFQWGKRPRPLGKS